jgi:O-Antigen ligase
MRQSESAVAATASANGPMVALAIFGGLLVFAGLYAPQFAAVVLLLVAGGLVTWAAWWVQADRAKLLCALVMLELFCSTNLIPVTEDQRFIIRYPLLLLFCLPTVVYAARNPLLWRGGIRDYLLYFGWGAVTITYSLLPGYSLARLSAAVLLFIVLVKIADEIGGAEDIERLLRWFLIGLSFMWLALIASLVALPHDLVWNQEEGIERLCGLFNSPNTVGEAMLATVCAVPLVWKTAGRWQRVLFGIEFVVAIALGALADSRSPIGAMVLSWLAYALWRYRLRALPILASGVLMLGIAVHVAPNYVSRGDVSTLTGRTAVWNFAVQKIKERPLTGWGYEVEGEILRSKYFSEWWGPWDDGPHSSLHNGYLSRAVGVGVPAFAFWVFIFLRPWFWLFRRSEDPWRLKRLALLVILPVLILNGVESTAGDCRYAVGMLAALCWAIAERQRIEKLDADRAERSFGSVFVAGASNVRGG